MTGIRTVLALVIVVISGVPGGVMGEPYCISQYDAETVDCPGPGPGGMYGYSCPESQTWTICGSTCDATPEEPAYYCEDEGKITCMECDDPESWNIIWKAHTVGSCYC
jgi:hypothetical protein